MTRLTPFGRVEVPTTWSGTVVYQFQGTTEDPSVHMSVSLTAFLCPSKADLADLAAAHLEQVRKTVPRLREAQVRAFDHAVTGATPLIDYRFEVDGGEIVRQWQLYVPHPNRHEVICISIMGTGTEDDFVALARGYHPPQTKMEN